MFYFLGSLGTKQEEKHSGTTTLLARELTKKIEGT
jgi:hypothetical protein